MLFEFFNTNWDFLGIRAPKFIWMASIGVLGWALVWLIRLCWLVYREGRIYKNTTKHLDDIRKQNPRRPGEGLSVSIYDAVVLLFEQTPSLRRSWQTFNSQIIRRSGLNGEEQIWRNEGAESAFCESNVTEAKINRSFYASTPGVITGVGLLFTFIAILVALKDVDVDETTKQVQGLDPLIRGLSGKFLSSIAALSSATLFIVFEKKVFYHLSNRRQELVAAVDSLFPYLSPVHILLELHRDISEQSIAFRQLNTDLAVKFRQGFNQGFNESMGPTLDRMVTNIEELGQVLRAAEAQKQESITDSLQDLLRNIQHSINTSLEKMGSSFSESLSGTARGQFDRVAESLAGTSKLLDGMNAQFQTTQAALNELINLARNTTMEQMTLGKSQIEELTAVLRGLMIQINETAGSSVSQMASALTSVVHDLSEKVTTLSQQMSQTLATSADKATNAASAVIEKAETWSSRNAEQLSQLLTRHQGQLDRIEEVRAALDSAMTRFKEAIIQHKIMVDDLRQISSQANSAVASIAGIAKSMKDAQDTMLRVAGQSESQVGHLAEANRRQQEVWQEIQGRMQQYQKLFDDVEKSAGEMLAQIGEQLRNYTASSQQTFEKLTEASNSHISNAVQRLGGSVDELREFLDDLGESLDLKGDNGKRR